MHGEELKTVTGKNSGRRTENADQGSYKGGANNRSCYKNEEEKEEERRTQFEKNCFLDEYIYHLSRVYC